MKRHIKKIITIALCMSMMQPTLQATPFGEFCRKWVSRATNAAYWGILGAPAIGMKFPLDKDTKGTDVSGTPYFPELKILAPEKYAEINALYEREGLERLDDYSIKVATKDGLKRFMADDRIGLLRKMYLLMHVYENGVSIGEKSFAVSEVYVQQTKEEQCVNDVCNTTKIREPLSVAGLAALFAHEKKHCDSHHFERGLDKKLCPLLFGAIMHGFIEKMGIFNGYSAITRSALKIPQFIGILGGVSLMNAYMSRQNEREADSHVKTSPILARGMIEFLEVAGNRKKELGLAQDTSLTTKLFSTHPPDEERIAYLEKWAKEAEAKKQQASAKED